MYFDCLKKINHLYANLTLDTNLVEEFLEESWSTAKEIEQSTCDNYVLTTSEDDEILDENYKFEEPVCSNEENHAPI